MRDCITKTHRKMSREKDLVDIIFAGNENKYIHAQTFICINLRQEYESINNNIIDRYL